MDKKSVKGLQKKIDYFYDINEDPQGSVLFVLKALLLKFLDNNDQVNFLDNQAAFQEAFTFDQIFAIWNQRLVKESFYPEKKLKLEGPIWQWLLAFIKDLPLLKGENTDIIGYIYEHQLIESDKKSQGVFYTPKKIADFMVSQLDQKKNGSLKILDPACGSGMLLSASYDYLFNYLSKGANKEKKRAIHQRLLENTLIGIDRDQMACLVTKIVLILKGDRFILPLGIYKGDILNQDLLKKESIDLVIANPPYVGHKDIDKAYMEGLKKKYSEIYQDKGDLSYCFVYRAWELLKNNGQLIYISSRYFLEAHFASGLRAFISQRFEIQELIDFNGNRVIEGVGIDPAILNVKKRKTIAKNHDILVKRFKMPGDHDLQLGELVDQLSLKTAKTYQAYFVDQKRIKKEPWRLYQPITREIIEKIEEKAPLFLSQVGQTFQGMITGNDKAFIFDKLPFKLKNQSVLKAWLKNKDVLANNVKKASKVLVYTDQIGNIEEETDLLAYLLTHQEKLKNRRECRQGKRPWYFLQWGRNLSNFEAKKIIFPYKAATNRFAVDNQGSCFSADIYGMHLKNQESHHYSEELLAFILNSRLYNYYFKSYAKKLGHNLYEYYPNTLLKLKIPIFKDQELNAIKDYYDIIKFNANEECDLKKNQEKKFNYYLYNYFDLNIDQINEIEKKG